MNMTKEQFIKKYSALGLMVKEALAIEMLTDLESVIDDVRSEAYSEGYEAGDRAGYAANECYEEHCYGEH